MKTRKTYDYSPLRPGSEEEREAINARRQMLRCISGRAAHRSRRSGLKASLAAYQTASK